MNIQIGSYVMYGKSGVCRVEDIRKETFGKDSADYYILKPVFDKMSTIYVPVNNPALQQNMRQVLTPEEIYALIRSMPELEDSQWIHDPRERNAFFKDVLQRGDRGELIQIIKTLYHHQKDATSHGKKLHAADDAIMKKAEKMLYDEFALVLCIAPDEVVPFITEQIHCTEKQQVQ